MTPERLAMAVQVLAEVSQAFSTMPEERARAAEGSIALCDAALYLTELTQHLSRGKDAYDAVLATIRGELRLSIPQGRTAIPAAPRNLTPSGSSPRR